MSADLTPARLLYLPETCSLFPTLISINAQSALAGGFMISLSFGTAAPTILDIVPYAGFGAFYFLISAIWLAVATSRGA